MKRFKKLLLISFMLCLVALGAVFTFNNFDVYAESGLPSVISTPYQNNIVEFIHTGEAHSINVNVDNVHQEVKLYRTVNGIDVEITNEFVDVGEYLVKACAAATDDYVAPNPVLITVRVLPKFLESQTEDKIFQKISIISDSGFSLDNTFIAHNLEKSEIRKAKNLVKNKISYEEKVVTTFSIAPQKELDKFSKIDFMLEIPKDYKYSQNYRAFHVDNGEVRELAVLANRGYFSFADVPTSGQIVVTRNKFNPYGWIWITIAILGLLGAAASLYFGLKRKAKFYLNGSLVRSIMVPRRGVITLSNGLEKYTWYEDKECLIQATEFRIKETSRKFYSKII